MEITRPRTCNENYTPWDLYCTPWESCGEGAYRNLLFYCRGVLTVLKSIHPRCGKKNVYSLQEFSFIEIIYSRKEKQRYFCQDTKFSSPPTTTRLKQHELTRSSGPVWEAAVDGDVGTVGRRSWPTTGPGKLKFWDKNSNIITRILFFFNQFEIKEYERKVA